MTPSKALCQPSLVIIIGKEHQLYIAMTFSHIDQPIPFLLLNMKSVSFAQKRYDTCITGDFRSGSRRGRGAFDEFLRRRFALGAK